MKARYKHLLEHSLGMMLSAIELYNKPDFKNREQIFSILSVASWESLLKARIIKDNNNKLTSLYIKQGARYKKNRSGSYMTIGIERAMTICGLPNPVLENLNAFIQIRDAAIHLTADSPTLPYLVFSLGSASLQNYSKLCKSWFDQSLSDYNFYILPLGFNYPFKKIRAVDIEREPEDIANVIRLVAESQGTKGGRGSGFFLMCEIETSLVSAKKITASTDFTTKIDQSGKEPGAVLVPRLVNLHDQYPLSYMEIYKNLKEQNPYAKQHELNDFIRRRNIKGDPRFSAYHYRNKSQEQAGPKKSTPVTYNSDFLELVLTEFEPQ